MTRYFHHAVFFVGLAAVCWVGVGYIGSNPLALAITLLIGAFYLMGALELHRFRQATATLAQSLADMPGPPASLGHWLDQLHPSLRNAVRLRIEGERVGLPGPALTPYLAGLLVLLGMLGTFLGMVVTLNGTGIALESAADLQAIRASLAAPVKGLGLAFGTSVAGVAASAMLGLVSALCRRDRLQAAQLLDTKIASTLRVFSLAHQREESFKLLQRQGDAMPELVDRLQAMMATMERQSQALNERLLASQDGFHSKAEAAYAGLASSVDRSLKQSLTESARVAGAAIQPVVEATMAGIAREAAAMHETIEHGVQRQLEGLSTRFEQHSASLLGTVGQAQAELQAKMASQDQQRLAAWTDALEAMASSLQQEWQQAGARSESQQQEICKTLAETARELSAQTEAHARSTIAEIAQLVQAASEAPRAAAEVIAELRQKLSDSMVRDNAMLEERSRILETLQTLLDGVNHASTEQRSAIDALVAASADVLDRVGTRFTDKVEAQTEKMAGVAAQITGSAVEVASLGEAFGFAVQLFSQSNDKLVAHLQRIESALGKSIARSDEQLDYYVAQAREVIDLSILSQKQIVEDLQQLASSRAPVGSEA
ncbi:apolipoprotein A1/A4/E domain-containing protein [Variovorax sp. MHTC-1]|uniref:apolipoprotein A1/A4/E domain-containing protein n=1 Tax=Variovorax sp. MHTC-1 TaxID=2495593 RepID=UPI000F88C82B|nr:apolipoprotein A1/A4/E domain-containing protein [Variovorax sp. MHTC-1]RST54353.1 hypothetical protein EJI01_10695 [Variovorax sp. MHTC-1]